MNRGFYTIMAAQFFSSLADNALLIAAIALLAEMHSPAWMTPLLKLFFVLSYVLLAAFVGAFADAFPKGKVMLITNMIKIVGCSLMFFTVHPLLAYAVVGFGAAAYSPAKYGILTELLPPEKLVAANGWIEGLTVGSIIMGTVLGGALVNPKISAVILSFDFPMVDLPIDTPTEAALCIISCIYIVAALFNFYIPDTGVRYEHQERNPLRLIVDFAGCFTTLWKDKLGQISLAVTTLFWGAGATLQFIVLKWAEKSLHMPLDKAAILQGIVAVGVALGAVAAARFVPLKKSLTVMPLGIIMGIVVMLMTTTTSVWVAYPLLVIVGALSGYFVVPMNALLQHRGHVLMSAGHSIAVQNFNENLSVLTMLVLYAFMVRMNLDVNTVIIIFGSFVAGIMYLIMRRHAANQREHDSLALIGEDKHPHH
ncbi:lysophospholipid transporter LplT [Herbaspirillum huttiense]|uniref:lysophospholipid transporter LplT n=1 Tax=Herbaspirillum TaxID=963 RepID=UPI000415735D|nr:MULTISPECIES: lysophospholipid transporter LplT [Herbaspirillum]MAF03164.1 lysophospholipid transporter LplT [Herbaspirillum sp.]MBN9356657.1 lysophospholipid transporter LplT [Herbaspirillum huttiense]MBO17478.1 lysophospholipid transporter LplT [Herbaspirillum sp.]MCP3655164.1 lysophospholipid transporter LplT [Herbaspirillum sp.]MCP3945657.1 lysophospholipid transporter LplT [Herbaspirillum sp.]|tara:strand:- start:1746 stop:3017 length:1272 start_codon:yes stop_codon:yes gene_type:complete